ncbi:MAG: hypothetical protein IT299_01620 [Dehalococcoidia bacterium]|nr:hypothetical protein [Dehalococcoidia bacterium]
MSSRGPLTIETLLDGTYPDMSGPETVTLTGGEWARDVTLTSGGSTRTYHESVRAFGSALGDLDDTDGVVVLGYNGGGTGTFMRLIPVLNEAGQLTPGALSALGDRISVRALEVTASGTVVVDALMHGIGDGLCCPTLPLRTEWQLHGSQLKWLDPEVCAGRCADSIGPRANP